MRLSRGRVLLRAGLLLLGGGYMLWRAQEARRLARLLPPATSVLQSRLALVWALVGALAIVTGLGVLAMLRPRRRPKTLQLRERPPGDGPGPP